jgi:hypothetical protein
MKEYAVGEELSPEQAKEAMKAGRILISKDGKQRAMKQRGNDFVFWDTRGSRANLLRHLADFTEWYIQERGDFPNREIATRKNTDTSYLKKSLL